jgi:hypothetical protein
MQNNKEKDHVLNFGNKSRKRKREYDSEEDVHFIYKRFYEMSLSDISIKNNNILKTVNRDDEKKNSFRKHPFEGEWGKEVIERRKFKFARTENYPVDRQPLTFVNDDEINENLPINEGNMMIVKYLGDLGDGIKGKVKVPSLIKNKAVDFYTNSVYPHPVGEVKNSIKKSDNYSIILYRKNPYQHLSLELEDDEDLLEKMEKID